MANIAAIASVGRSIEQYLNQAYHMPGSFGQVTRPECTFSLEPIGGLQTGDAGSSAAVRVRILLYRASMNPHMRTSGRLAEPDMDPPPLSVDLHYLLTFWSNSAESEQLVFAWTLRQMHQTPVLDASILMMEGGWGADDVIQLIPEEISNEDLMRIWDTLEPDYRLSIPYIARVVRIDPIEHASHRRVVATRMNFAVPERRS